MGHPSGRGLGRQILAALACVATVAGYCVLVAQLNKPVAAHAPSAATIAALDKPSPSTTTTTTTALSTAPKLPILPGPLRSPRAGTYVVRSETNGQKVDGTLVVGKDGAQLLSIGGRITPATVQRTPRGALVARADGTCTWAPPVLVVANNLKEGRRWASDTGCALKEGGVAQAIKRHETARVIRRLRVGIGAQQVDGWVIERHIVTSKVSTKATVVSDEASRELFVPSLGLIAYRVSRIDTPQPDGKVVTVEETFQLVDVVPS